MKANGLLELWENPGDLEQVGGLDALKAWLVERKDAFSQRACDYGLVSM